MEGWQGFSWTAGEGMVGLGTLSESPFSSNATAVSADGSVIVGDSRVSPSEYHAFRWTAGTGMLDLGDLPGGVYSTYAQAVSSDGSVIVGKTENLTTHNYGTFIWDAAHGMRDLGEVLTGDYGLDLTGWTLSDATGISADGMVIVGYGRNPTGQSEAWMVVIPEPGTLSLLALGGLALIRRRKRSGQTQVP